MPYEQEVKQAAYALDPECWVSYSGKPKEHKQWMDSRRTASLEAAQRAANRRPKPEPTECPCCGRPL